MQQAQWHLVDTKALGGNPQIEAQLMGARWMAGYLDISGLTHVGKSNLVERCLGAQPILPLTYGFRREKPHKHTNKHEMHLDTQGHDLKLYVQHNTNNNQGGKRIAETT